MKSEFYIWRDTLDGNWFMLGVRLSNGQFAAECSIFIDAIFDLFGRQFHESIKNMKPGIPIHIESHLEIEK